MADGLADGSQVLLALWADTIQVHALLLDETSQSVFLVSLSVEAGLYPALSRSCPTAAWFERMINDLWGHVAEAGRDPRPWLDHGTWPQPTPMALRPDPARSPYQSPEPAEPGRDPLMQLSLGPLWGRIEEAAQLRLTLNGTTVTLAESRLGYSHKGVLTLIRGKSPRTAARFAARLSADATVAHSIAFAAAAEAASDVVAPPRAVALRVVMMEIERIGGHLDNLAEIGRLANAGAVQTRCALLRERLVSASAAAFGHRLMMDCVIPGGVAIDISAEGAPAILRALGDISSQLRTIRDLHDNTALSARLTGVGRADGRLASALGVGGIVGRASGRAFDARALTSGYDRLTPGRLVRDESDAAARQHLRITEIEVSLGLVSAALDGLPAGPLTVALPQSSGEGIGCAESMRGDVWHWLRLDHGQIAAGFPRDPGWALWPLAERVLQSAAAEDADLIRVSFALPASAVDL